MSTRARIAVTAIGAGIFAAIFYLTGSETGRIGYITWRLKHWRGDWVDWACLAIALGVTLAVAIILWTWTERDASL